MTTAARKKATWGSQAHPTSMPSIRSFGKRSNTPEKIVSMSTGPILTIPLTAPNAPLASGGEAGDLHLLLRLDDDDTYRSSGRDVEARVALTPWEAQAGAKVDVRTARGTVTVTIPAESRSGNRLRLRGQGFADGRGGRGDCIVRLEMDLPRTLTQRQKELLQELGAAAASGFAGGAREGGPR